MTFKLDPSKVVEFQQNAQETGERVMAAAKRAEEAITGIAGGSWTGQASSKAAQKQSEELFPVALKLQGRVNHIAEALGQARAITVQEDEDVRDAFEQIPGADSFNSRMNP